MARGVHVLAVLVAGVALLTFAAVPAGAQIDLNGHWRDSTGVFEVTQTGSDVTFFSGALSGSVTADGHLFVSASVPGCALFGIDAQVIGDRIDGSEYVCSYTPEPFYAERCQCFDGIAVGARRRRSLPSAHEVRYFPLRQIRS